MSYRAVCFDLDGTLLDTLDDLADSMNRTLEANNLPTHPVPAYRYFVGAGMRMLAHRVLPDGLKGNAEIEEALYQGARAQYAKRWAEKTKPYAGSPSFASTNCCRTGSSTSFRGSQTTCRPSRTPQERRL